MIAANIQDRDCAAELIRATRKRFPFMPACLPMAAMPGRSWQPRSPVSRSSSRSSSAPTRKATSSWCAAAGVVERTFSWLRRNRRLMAHYEALSVMAVGFAKLAMIKIMAARLASAEQPK